MSDPPEPPPDDPFGAPRIRYAMTVVIPPNGQTRATVTVKEQKASLILAIEVNSLSREIPLTVSEARALADHLNRICRRIRERPSWKP
jgi:hypothetical protein